MKSPLPRKLRKQLSELIGQADKVLRYREDLLTPEERSEIVVAADHLRAVIDDPAGTVELAEERADALDECLRRHGGRIHPKTFLSDNIETIVVAAIVVIAIRTFFFQPFIIPTNSMYPSYSGMQVVVYGREDAPEAPGGVAQLFRGIFLGAGRTVIKAPESGRVWIGVREIRSSAGVQVTPVVDTVRGRKWLVVPARKRVGVLRVGESTVEVRVPGEFADLHEVYNQTFFPEHPDRRFLENLRRQMVGKEVVRFGRDGLFIPLDLRVEEGDRLLDFEILSGDALFVDRFSYHFRRPQVGDPVVFRTGKIPELPNQYYIKRLVGTPGDKLELREPLVLRNDEPLEGAEAFEFNFDRINGYHGYGTLGRQQRYLKEGVPLVVPENRWFVLGDNSPNSSDGRVFGFVPEKEVIGRAVFIYYPFTHRWGPSK